jgi:hypothetical protein
MMIQIYFKKYNFINYKTILKHEEIFYGLSLVGIRSL